MSDGDCSTCSSRGTCDIKDEGGSCSTGSCGGVRLPPGITTVYDLDMDVERGCMVWAELEGAGDECRISEASLQIMARASSLWDERVFAVMMAPGSHRWLAESMFRQGVDTVYHVRGPEIERFQAMRYSQALSEIIDRVKPAVFLCAATPRGRALAPCLAAKRGCGLTADCTAIEADGQKLRMMRPAFGGNILASIESRTLPQMATVRPGAYPLPELREERKGTVITWTSKAFNSIAETISILRSDDKGVCDSADVLISLGAGVCSDEDIKTAEELARLLGAGLTCSRAVVESGKMGVDRQVGQSGRIVRPRIYLAFGISGALQHRVGMSESETIIAVNNDPDAPIHSMADVSVVADGKGVMQAMVGILRQG